MLLLAASYVSAQTPATLFEHMNTSSPGTAMTTTILNNGMDSGNCTNGSSTYCNWSSISGSGVQVGSNVAACDLLAPIAVRGGSTYTTGTGHNSIEVLGADAFSYAIMSFGIGSGAQSSNMSALFCVQTPNSLGNGVLDLFRFSDLAGNQAVVEIQPIGGGNVCNSPSNSNQWFNFEYTYLAGAAQGGGCIIEQPNTVYWIAVNANETATTWAYTVYSATGTIVGSASGGAGTFGSSTSINDILLGQFENGTPTNNLYLQNLVIDTTGTWPLAPGASAPASTPTFSPGSGDYSSSQNVAISSTSSGAVICYNLTGAPATNGTTGCTAGSVYSSPVTVASNETLFAVAGGAGYIDSGIGSAFYTICGGVVYNAASCSYVDILAALPSSGTGPATVIIPSCSTPWTSNLNYTQPSGVTCLKLIGAGTPNSGISTFGAGTPTSIITDNAGNTNPLMFFNISYPQSLTVQNLDILPFTGSTALVLPIEVLGTCTSSGCPNLRLDNLEFGNGSVQWTHTGNGANSSAMIGITNVYGVADHNTLPAGSDVRMIDVSHSSLMGIGHYGDKSWALPDSYGTASTFYVENNLFSSIAWPFSDSEININNSSWNRGGGRYVARYNHITTASGGNVSGHGTETGVGRPRGVRQIEAYGNTFTCTSGCPSAPLAPRSGVSLMFGNSIVNAGGSWASHVNYYEARRGSGPTSLWLWGAGTGPYDQNTGQNSTNTGSPTVFDSGTTTGGNTGSLTDTSKSWTAHQWLLDGAPYSAWDTVTGCGLEILDNTATGLTLMNSSSTCTIGTGHAYQILQATVLIDQPTRGQSALLDRKSVV